MINYWRPIEIVMNQKSEDSSLFKIIHKTFKNAYIGFLPRNKFNMIPHKLKPCLPNMF